MLAQAGKARRGEAGKADRVEAFAGWLSLLLSLAFCTPPVLAGPAFRERIYRLSIRTVHTFRAVYIVYGTVTKES